jgi:hypothetical protein
MEKPLIYLSLDATNGVFFQFSKNPQEGFVKIEKNNKVFYRRDCDIVVGYIKSISERSRTLTTDRGSSDIVELSVAVEGDNAVYLLSFGRDSQNGYSSFTESFLSHLPNLEKNVKYTIKPYSFIPEGKERSIKGFSFTNADSGVKVGKLKTTYTDKEGNVTKGDLPERKFVEKRGKWTVDQDDYLEALYVILEKGKSDFPYQPTGHVQTQPVVTNSNTNSSNQGQSISTTVPNKTKVDDIESVAFNENDINGDDDLPF